MVFISVRNCEAIVSDNSRVQQQMSLKGIHNTMSANSLDYFPKCHDLRKELSSRGCRTVYGSQQCCSWRQQTPIARKALSALCLPKFTSQSCTNIYFCMCQGLRDNAKMQRLYRQRSGRCPHLLKLPATLSCFAGCCLNLFHLFLVVPVSKNSACISFYSRWFCGMSWKSSHQSDHAAQMWPRAQVTRHCKDTAMNAVYCYKRIALGSINKGGGRPSKQYLFIFKICSHCPSQAPS